MKKLAVAMSAVGMFAFASAASAAATTARVTAPTNAKAATPASAKAAAPTSAKEANVSGKILRVDPANQTVTLADGQYYMVPASIKLDTFKTGDQITMSVEKDQYGIFTVKTIAEAGQKG